MAHFRAFFVSGEFMTAADLYNADADEFREITVTISKVAPVKLTGKKGKVDGRPGVFFKESKTGKPLGANATNSAAISNIAGSADTKKWPGTKITLFVEMVEIRGEGIRPAVRVRPFRADQQRAARGATPEKPPTDETPDEEEIRMIAEREREEASR
ncbi:MAG: hypothetical protein H0U52_16245 [Chloroflexi bacterium]|nr:hypothetical protein [Chloroflexota bacterium]